MILLHTQEYTHLIAKPNLSLIIPNGVKDLALTGCHLLSDPSLALGMTSERVALRFPQRR
jgi:hypothetical protein